MQVIALSTFAEKMFKIKDTQMHDLKHISALNDLIPRGVMCLTDDLKCFPQLKRMLLLFPEALESILKCKAPIFPSFRVKLLSLLSIRFKTLHKSNRI